jgi:hypothetical protein
MKPRIAIVVTAVLIAGLVPAPSLLAQPPSGRPPLQGGVRTTEPRGAAPRTFEEIPARYREGFDGYALFDEDKRLLDVADRRLSVAERCHRTAAHQTR